MALSLPPLALTLPLILLRLLLLIFLLPFQIRDELPYIIIYTLRTPFGKNRIKLIEKHRIVGVKYQQTLVDVEFNSIPAW